MVVDTTIDTQSHKRITTRMPVKFLVEGVIELKGIVISMSVSEMVIASRQPVKLGDEIIAYINGAERFAGVVSRSMANVFSVRMELPQTRQVRVIELLATEQARQDGTIDDRDSPGKRRRLFRRVQTKQSDSICTREDGSSKECSVFDVSLTAISIKIAPVLRIGEIVRIGKISARVRREIMHGFDLELIASSPLIENDSHATGSPDVSDQNSEMLKATA